MTRARQIHYELIPVYDGMFRNQGAVMTKAALDLLGQPGGAVRLPLLAATDAERHQEALDLTAGGVKLPGTAHARDQRVSHPHPDLAPPGKLARNGLRLVPLGGLGEIGLNMPVLEQADGCSSSTAA